jgi:hypothetical protein
MINTSSGGDGMPPPLERAKVVEFTATEDTDCHFYKKKSIRIGEITETRSRHQHGVPRKKS